MYCLCMKQAAATGQTVLVVVWLQKIYKNLWIPSGKHELRCHCQVIIRIAIVNQYQYWGLPLSTNYVELVFTPINLAIFRGVQKMPGGLGMICAVYQDVYLQNNVAQRSDPGYILRDSSLCQSGYTSIWRRGPTVGSRVSIDVIPLALLQHQMDSRNTSREARSFIFPLLENPGLCQCALLTTLSVEAGDYTRSPCKSY